MIGCSQKTIVQTKYQYVDYNIPFNLFECNNIPKPYAKDEKDVIIAYINLYKQYRLCQKNINLIKNIYDNHKERSIEENVNSN